MPANGFDDAIVVENVVAVYDGISLMCDVSGRRVGIPYSLILLGSEVRKAGDSGRLVVARRFARDLGLLFDQ